MKTVRILAALLAVLALSVAVACGDDDDDDDSADDGGGEATEATAPEGEGETLAITILDFAYDPPEFTVPADTEITFDVANDDDVTHTFTVYTDEEYSEATGVDVEAAAGAAGEGAGTFAAGEYYFRCELHPSQMIGEFLAE